ncbi:MAG: flagellar hook-length control protein FliK, partial [Desulfotomaculaceae bacterium]
LSVTLAASGGAASATPSTGATAAPGPAVWPGTPNISGANQGQGMHGPFAGMAGDTGVGTEGGPGGAFAGPHGGTASAGALSVTLAASGGAASATLSTGDTAASGPAVWPGTPATYVGGVGVGYWSEAGAAFNGAPGGAMSGTPGTPDVPGLNQGVGLYSPFADLTGGKAPGTQGASGTPGGVTPYGAEVWSPVDRTPAIPNNTPATFGEGALPRPESSMDMENSNTFSFDNTDSTAYSINSSAGSRLESVRIVNLMEAVARHVQVMQQKGNGTAKLQFKLEPESLGEVTIKLVFSNGRLNAQFIAASYMARDAIDQSIAQLRESLAQHNIFLDEASVSTGEKENPQSQERGYAFGEKKPQHEDSTGYNGSGEDDTVTEKILERYGGPVSKVNYLV